MLHNSKFGSGRDGATESSVLVLFDLIVAYRKEPIGGTVR